MKARSGRWMFSVLAALWVSASPASWAADELGDGAQPAAPVALSCGGDIIPILKAVDDLRREQAELARGPRTLALQVVEARLAVAEAVRLFAFSRYAGRDPAEAIAAMQEAVARAEGLPRVPGADIVAAARGTLAAMRAAVDTTRVAGAAPTQP